MTIAFKPKKTCLDPEMDVNCLICGQKSKFYNLNSERSYVNVYHYFGAKSNGDSPVAQTIKPITAEAPPSNPQDDAHIRILASHSALYKQ